ncbi:MAG TPA: NADH-quinone oxidoreductase subunit D [Acidimicrobiia bacterium]|nr:NADH-quinone oxidoreductase subunit D [Acidimicrobiia bacterium]
MSNPPDIVTGETETYPQMGETEAPPTPPEKAPPSKRRTLHDMWVSGTEAPVDTGRFTDEGAQEMLADEDPEVLAGQRGTLVVDDYDEAEVSDEETQIVNMGPQHPATHGVLRLQLELEGETIRRVKPIIGYLHTGIERTAETLTFMQGPTAVTRMDYLSPFFNELAFSMAVERLLDLEVPPRARAIRILMTELNRVSSHLLWAATTGLDIGALSMMIYGWREREAVLGFFEKTTGLRMNHNYIRPGGVSADLPDGWEEDIAAIEKTVLEGLADYEGLLMENPIFLERTQGVGVLTPEECLAYGVTGVLARASGIDFDLRKAFPYSGIDQYEFDVPVAEHGDVYDRFVLRFEEIRQSLRIVRQVVDAMPRGDYRSEDRKVTPPPRARIDQSMEALIHHFKIFTEGYKVPAGEVYQAVESPRGELGVYLVSSGGAKPWRVHVRGPSFAHVQALPAMLTDSLIADTIAALASADPVMGDVDR